ncbi:MAG TPA: DHA2 family efflux MFS transporter permease subunit [Kofleriaceae bacterium]|nr:DHA2 family efflux MFS transporter permease subunit [Kofleriaceae bacterium]
MSPAIDLLASRTVEHPTEAPARRVGSRRRPMVILVTCCLALVLATMDVTIVNIALPAIRGDLHASVAELQWSIDGYTVVVASFLLLAGSVADRFGRRRTFQIGLAVFSLGSLLCSVAPSAGALVVFRMLQAVGGAMLNPVAMSIIVNTFVDPKERARAIGVWGAAFGVAMAAGPLLGGLLVESVGWRSIFWVNIPFGILALVLTARFVPESRAERPRRFDLVAQVLVVTGLFALTSAVIDGRRVGWGSWPIATGFATAAACVAGLVVWESRRREPMLDLRFFRSLPFAAATVVAVLAFISFNGFLFLNSLYLQESRGMHASAAGLATFPVALALMVCSPLSGRLVGAGRARVALVVAGAAIATGALLLTALAPDTSLAYLVAAYGIFGVGLGAVNAPITNTAVSGMPRSQAALASAVASTSRQVGASLGVALAGSLAGAGIDAAHRPDFAAATHVVFWVIVGLGAAISVLGVVSTGARARASADRVAHLVG